MNNSVRSLHVGENFTVAINPIPVKIIRWETTHTRKGSVKKILTSAPCFFLESQVYFATCLSIEEGFDQ